MQSMILPLEAAWPPGVHSFEFPYLWGTNWVNKPFLQACIALVLIITFWIISSRKLKIVPSKAQFFAESIYDFVRNGIARDMLGVDYKKFMPILLTIFCWVLVNNWFGQLFLFMVPTFSKIGYPMGLAAIAWFTYIGAGVARHGLHYFSMQLIPEGVPGWLLPMIIPLEFLSNFIVRPITLMLRSFATMFAGHLVVMVFTFGGEILLTTAGNTFYNVSGAVSILFAIPVMFLELFIGALQAYIFTVLTAQYISSSIAEAH